MPTAHLTDRAIVAVAGPDAESFLQNILTVDLAGLGKSEAQPGALLSPQGKILFDFLISRVGGDGFRLECRADIAADFMRRLMLYRLRAKAEISKEDQALVAVEWPIGSATLESDSGSSPSDSTVVDRRFAGVVRRFYGDLPEANASADDWRSFRVAQGVPESGDDFVLGEAFPHDALLDQMGGVGFRKGCYVGQEVVSRMQHRGTARRRFLIASGDADLPPPQTPVTAAGRAIGSLGSSSGRTGLALVRIDRVKEALDAGEPITAKGVALDLSIPDWATFTFPADAPAAEEG